MSPNVADRLMAVFFPATGALIWLLFYSGRLRWLIGILAFVSLSIGVYAAGRMAQYGTGKARWEMRDNPDGTRTWQRVEVSK